MSTYVRGFIPPDADWQRMRAVWDACMTAGVAVPAEVGQFFGGEKPDPAGPQVKIIRFWNSW